MANHESLRRAVWRANELGAVVPCLVAALDSLDSSRDAWLPVNLVQVPQKAPVVRGTENGFRNRKATLPG